MNIEEWWPNVDWRDQRKLKEHSHGDPLSSDLRIALAKAGREGDDSHLSKSDWRFVGRQSIERED